MYMTLEELTHEQQMIAEYGDCFMFLLDESEMYTSDGKKFMYETDAIKLFVAALPSDAESLQLVDAKGRMAIVHRCSKTIGVWQVSFFDSNGAYADTVRDTRDEAVVAAIERGFKTIVAVM
ncbi:hypothetical protein [Alicyclobacillus acidoterrestris]|uniref:Uncharacterized protein n=1 Tax=Alicyclobacillus acidoterrestris (strain ATCC 49025 / DSM 3922 / CIP 106132 / NCIMB 13137 / GD3B) TaxID=1356854 RepID=T0C557_ALIAG|nr:hypothetical protein [Alicyclobacillus acidoterrestris]EPZ47680.1 hypothetical protein N007_05345 [Alicyclobacillus acidoterrestris ATCC 49025]UNO48001.1 hypothetical protein K1I37_15105 [Alicyclobacillus acidoterrestris]